jgi:voltage-gated potassium channel
VSPRRLSELERRERWLAVTALVFRVTVIVALLLVVYYALPAGRISGSAALVRLAVGCVVFLVVMIWLVRRILKADLPGLRAIEGLACAVPLFLFLFANVYLSLSHSSAAAFSEPLDHTGALYFTITVFATVGFGDITPKAGMSRIIVSIQMLLDLVLLGALVKVVVGAAKVGVARGRKPEQS